jgi:hypothetical protein
MADADLVMKRHDTDPPLRLTLLQKNAEGEVEPIDLAGAVKVTMNLKPSKGTAANTEHLMTSWGGGSVKLSTGALAGQVEYQWAQEDLDPPSLPEILNADFRIEWPETGGVKRFQTCPNSGYRTIEVVADNAS